MAGNYPDVPDHRMAYDSDGTVVVKIGNTGTNTIWTLAQMQATNDNSTSTKTDGGASAETSTQEWTAFLFPEQRDVNGIYIQGEDRQDSFAVPVQYSNDTTNGRDGTWTSAGTAQIASSVSDLTFRRTQIRSLSITNVKAIRIGGIGRNIYSNYMRTIHIYGHETSTAIKRLFLWHPTLDQRLGAAALDLAEVTQNTNGTKTFRVKNPHTQQANSVVLTTEILTDVTPSVPPQFDYDLGSGYATTQNLGNIAAGAISGVITMRRTTPSNAVLSLFDPRIRVTPASWT